MPMRIIHGIILFGVVCLITIKTKKLNVLKHHSVVVGHGPKGMVDHYISQSRAVSQPGREINMATFHGNVSFTSCHFNVLSVPSATYI